jgi:hypothetical protein
MNENMPLKYKQMQLDHDLSASVCHLTYPYLFGGYFFTQNINGHDSITGYMRWDGAAWFHY